MMALDKEWGRRIEAWLDELRKRFYIPMGKVEVEGFTTFDRLSPGEASSRDFRPFPAGSSWGAKWEYGWFRASLELPPEAAGRRIVLRLKPGREGIAFVNGAAAGAIDRQHGELTLARPARGGERFEILAEFYAGHGPIEENCGPVAPGASPIPETPPAQRTVEESDWGEWDDEAFALWVDAEALYQTRSVLPETSLRVSEIDSGLRAFASIVDFELPPDAMRETVRAARARLSPLLACRNGSTAPLMHVFGNSHLDLAWQWPREETVRKSARTMSTQLALLDEYSGYAYYLCQVPLMEMLRDSYPEIWARTKARIADGSVMVDGGMWLEPDTNLPWGEALVRQVILAKEFFRKELGRDTKVLWLPDTFGFSAALPQIMRGTGLDYFATKKIIDGYTDGDPFPLVTFGWKGLDGSEVLAHVYRKCNSPLDPKTLAKRWNVDRRQLDGVSTYLFPFGYGDGGGGPTREMLEFAKRLGDLEGNPRTKMSGPLEFFRELESLGPPERSYEGELYFQEHRGTYTSQARTKLANRRAEAALRDAELWLAFASGAASGEVSGGRPGTPIESAPARLRGAWRGLLMNHFHDVVSGASIGRVHAEAVAELEAVRAEAEALRGEAFASLADQSRKSADSGFSFFNSLSWKRKELVLIPEKGLPQLEGPDGAALPAQEGGEGTWVEVSLPSCGWASCPTLPRGAGDSAAASAVALAEGGVSLRREGGLFVLENGELRATVDALGRLPSVIDKRSGLEAAAAPCNELRLFRDVNSNYDAWDIESLYAAQRVDLGDEAASGAEIEVLAEGPLFAALRVRRRVASSLVEQEIRLARGSRRIEFRTKVDWREDHKLLKAAFPTTLKADDALYEIQFGHVRRPTHRNRRYDADRFECCQHRWTALAEAWRGAAILNDCKYGSDVLGGTMSLTLLKAAFVPDPGADRGRHEFNYAFYVWTGPFASEGPVREAYAFNYPVAIRGGAPAGVVPMCGAGSTLGALAGAAGIAVSAGGAASLLSIEGQGIVLEAAKLAEDGSGDLVLRLYESSGSATRASLRPSPALGLETCRETNLLEEGGEPEALEGGALALAFRAFEIKTIRLGRSSQLGGTMKGIKP
jgi:alpha-mannosidase